MLRQLISCPKKIFRSLDLRSQISKRIMWIISKSDREKIFFFYIFAIHSSSRHEKRCQISLRIFSLFRGSIYQQCQVGKSKMDEKCRTSFKDVPLFIYIIHTCLVLNIKICINHYRICSLSLHDLAQRFYIFKFLKSKKMTKMIRGLIMRLP